MSVVTAFYLMFLAAAAGYVLIGRVPSLLHTPLLSGSNFIHGIVLAGAMIALANASGTLELVIGFIAVTAASANVVGGFVVTDRMLNLFENKAAPDAESLLSQPSDTAEGKGSIESRAVAAGQSAEKSSYSLADKSKR